MADHLNHSSNSVPLPSWSEPDSQRAGRKPNGFKLNSLEFGAEDASGSPTLERLGLDELIGADAFTSADIKANHTEPGVLTGMLSETMAKLEEKYHSGAYDAAAMPLVEQYLEEMRNMASIQLERYELIGQRVVDIKEANQAAYNAVHEARQKRETEIRERSALIADERRITRLRREQRRKARQEARDYRKLLKELERSERHSAKQRIAHAEEEAKVAASKDKALESAVRANQQEALARTQLAQEELRRAEAEAAAKQAELTGAKAAANAAEQNLARTCTEIAEEELRIRHDISLEEMRQSADVTKKLLDERMNQIKLEATKLAKEASSVEEQTKNLDETPAANDPETSDPTVEELDNDASTTEISPAPQDAPLSDTALEETDRTAESNIADTPPEVEQHEPEPLI